MKKKSLYLNFFSKFLLKVIQIGNYIYDEIQLLKQKISLIEQNELKNKKIDLLQSKINDYERRLSLCQR